MLVPVIVGEHDDCGIQGQHPPDHFPGTDAGAVDRAAKHLFEMDHAVAIVQEQAPVASGDGA